MYSEDQIKTLKWQDHVRKRPEMYFGTNGPSPQAICSAIGEGALILGADSIMIKKVRKLWLVAANIDWLNVNTHTSIKDADIFNSFLPFPEAGQNSLRFECMANLYSRMLAIHLNGETNLLKGCENDLSYFNECTKDLGFKGRVVGFEFSEST